MVHMVRRGVANFVLAGLVSYRTSLFAADVRLFEDVPSGRWMDRTDPPAPNNVPSLPDDFIFARLSVPPVASFPAPIVEQKSLISMPLECLEAVLSHRLTVVRNYVFSVWLVSRMWVAYPSINLEKPRSTSFILSPIRL